MPFSSHIREFASSIAGHHDTTKQHAQGTVKEQSYDGVNYQTTYTPPLSESALTTEGVRLSHSIWKMFWNPNHQHFTTSRPSAETVDGWNGVVLWPYTIAVEALLEAEAARPGEFVNEVTASLQAMDKFFSKEHDSYCAWVYSPGNTDIYYDDNAQVAIALLRAYSLPSLPTNGKKHYLSQAKKVINFLFTGWDHTNGGMHWHLKKPARNACSTNLSAVAALQLAHILHAQKKSGAMEAVGIIKGDKTEEQLIQFAKKCLEWVQNELASPSTGLIKDGIGGGPTWTYNSGAALHVMCLLYQLHPDPSLEAQAEKLALASIDRRKSLFDTSVPDIEWRYWWDSTFFSHLLIEGLVSYVETFGQLQPQSAAKVKDELARQMNYLQSYIRDKNDGSYWRSLRMYAISKGHTIQYRELTGDKNRRPDCQADERWKDAQSMKLPVDQRPMCKTVLGNGGAARGLLIAGHII